MANHKRKGPKSTRSGCLLCKPHKHQRTKKKHSAQRRRELRGALSEREQRSEF